MLTQPLYNIATILQIFSMKKIVIIYFKYCFLFLILLPVVLNELRKNKNSIRTGLT